MEDFFQDGFKPSTGLTIGAIACGAGKLQTTNQKWKSSCKGLRFKIDYFLLLWRF